MSTTILSSPTITPSALPPPPADNGGSGGSGRTGVNYFLGFLATFVVLLIIFVGCGCFSRRRFAARRRVAMAAHPGYIEEAIQVEPTYFEPWVTKGNTTWRTMMPLSAAILRDNPTSDELIPSPPVTPPPPPRLSIFSFPSWIPSIHRKPKLKPETNEKAPELEKPPDPLEIQVVVMIAMPRNAKNDRTNEPEEYEFGMTMVPYGGEIIPS